MHDLRLSLRFASLFLFGKAIVSPHAEGETAFLKVSGRVSGVEEPVVVRAIIERSDGTFVPGEWGNSSWPEVVIRGKAMGPDNVLEVPLGGDHDYGGKRAGLFSADGDNEPGRGGANLSRAV